VRRLFYEPVQLELRFPARDFFQLLLLGFWGVCLLIAAGGAGCSYAPFADPFLVATAALAGEVDNSRTSLREITRID
jgi:hypothetical protein